MGRINLGRVVLGGLVAGVVANALDFVINAFLMTEEGADMAQRLNLSQAALDSSVTVWIVVDFIWGLLLVFAFSFYSALETRAVNLTLLCVLAGLSAGLTNGSFAVLLTDLFPTRVRFTGVALVFNVSFTIFSGTAPLVATALIRDTGQASSPAYMMMASAALALVGTLWVERFGGNVLARRGSQ